MTKNKHLPLFKEGEEIELWNYNTKKPNKVKVIISTETQLTIEYKRRDSETEQDTATVKHTDVLLNSLQKVEEYNSPLGRAMSEDNDD